MTKISIFGKGNMGKAIGKNFEDAGNPIDYIQSDSPKIELGEIVVLAVPYPAVSDILNNYSTELDGKIVVDITNPVNFDTFDGLVVPSDSSAAEIISGKLPNSKVVKGFNTTFAATLLNKKVSDDHITTVLLAGDDEESKNLIIKSLDSSGLAVIDAGNLNRARELESLGFLQLSLAASKKISWTGGFGVFK